MGEPVEIVMSFGDLRQVLDAFYEVGLYPPHRVRFSGKVLGLEAWRDGAKIAGQTTE